MVGTYIMLIGQDTRFKHKFVKWEAEVAIEQGCRIIGVNLDKYWQVNSSTCPPVIDNIGAIFVPFSPQIVQYALQDYTDRGGSKNWYYYEYVYKQLGYILNGDRAERPAPPPLSSIFDALNRRS